MKRTCLAGVVATILFFNTSALADSIMCREGVVNTGNNKDDVLHYCGKPVLLLLSKATAPEGPPKSGDMRSGDAIGIFTFQARDSRILKTPNLLDSPFQIESGPTNL